jgi:hypothetical protein
MSKYFYFAVSIVSVLILSLLITGYFLIANIGRHGFHQVLKHDYEWGSTNACLQPSQEGEMSYGLHVQFDLYSEYAPKINAITISSIKMSIHQKDTVYWDRKGSFLLEEGERYSGYKNDKITFVTPYYLKFGKFKFPYEPMRMDMVCTFETENGATEKNFEYLFKTKGLNHNTLIILGLEGCIPK